MKFIDYLNSCLQNDEFRKYWEEDNPAFENIINVEEMSISDAWKFLNEHDADDVIKNKGIHPADLTRTEIIFFENNNDCPVEKFLNSINNQKLKEKTLNNIAKLSEEGYRAHPPLSKYVDDGIFELRTKYGSDIDRIFYFFIFGNKIILTNGYIKKSQKIDKEEFNRAKKYQAIYLRKYCS